MRLFFAISKPDNSFCNRLMKARGRDLAELCYLTDTHGTAGINQLIIQLIQRLTAMTVKWSKIQTGFTKFQQYNIYACILIVSEKFAVDLDSLCWVKTDRPLLVTSTFFFFFFSSSFSSSSGATTHCGLHLQPSSVTTASSRTRLLDHTQRRATVGRTPLDE